MGFLANILTPKGDTVSGLLDGAGELTKDIANSIRGQNPELDEKIAQLEQIWRSDELRQSSKFVKGWRPYMGWWLGTAIGMNFVVNPYVNFVAELKGWVARLPDLDIIGLLTVVAPFLLLGVTRTVEKIAGVVNRH